MSTNGGSTVTVLYKIVNSDSDSRDGLYNAFQMPAGRGLTLANVKQYVLNSSDIGLKRRSLMLLRSRQDIVMLFSS